jgi:hypothetical protein
MSPRPHHLCGGRRQFDEMRYSPLGASAALFLDQGNEQADDSVAAHTRGVPRPARDLVTKRGQASASQ